MTSFQIIKALQRSQSCLLESPTGSGNYFYYSFVIFDGFISQYGFRQKYRSPLRNFGLAFS